MAMDMAHQLNVPNPRMYKREAKQVWTAFSRHPKSQKQSVHKQVKAQLQYVRRDLRYINLDYSPRYLGHEIASGRSESNVWSVANTD